MEATRRLYWEEDHGLNAAAVVVAVSDNKVALDQTGFYPGGGGQPCDTGTLWVCGMAAKVVAMEVDAEGVLWHVCESAAEPGWVGQPAEACVDQDRRTALARYHTVLHVLNTIAQRDYGAWMTGGQIGVDYSRIDFKWEGFSPAVCREVEAKVNAVLARDRRIIAYSLPEEEFAARPELLRTLEVRPPVIDGQVRVVEIEGFDAQACGGTHVSGTRELGRFSITRTDNKGKINRRFYVELA